MCKQTENEQENCAQDLSFEQEQESLLQALWLKDVQQNNNQLSLFLLVVSNLGVISNVARCFELRRTGLRSRKLRRTGLHSRIINTMCVTLVKISFDKR